MKTYGRVRVHFHAFSTSALFVYGDDWSFSHFRPYAAGEKGSVKGIGGSVCPRDGLDVME